MVTKKLTTRKAPVKRKKKPRKVQKHRLSPWWIAAAVVLLAGGIFYPYFRAGYFATEGAAVPLNARKFCVDLSHYNEGIVWDSLMVLVNSTGHTSKDLLGARKVYPVSRVIMKATEGEKMVDRRFREYWKEAEGRECTRGAYHFFRSSKDPARQARHYAATVRLSHKDLPPILDVETMHEGCTKELLNERVLIWLRETEKTYGRKPIVYTSDSYARDILSPEITEKYPMWIARYNAQPPRFRNWTMWQFTDKALIHGIDGYVDLSVIKD